MYQLKDHFETISSHGVVLLANKTLFSYDAHHCDAVCVIRFRLAGTWPKNGRLNK